MITTNTGAKKLESSDNWREIFPNSDLGTAGAHNASVDAADRIQAEVAPIINGKQCALGAAKGDYVLLRNSTITGKTDGAYVAAKAIPANTDIDSTYLGSAITGGISNELNSNITNKWNVVNNSGLSNGVYAVTVSDSGFSGSRHTIIMDTSISTGIYYAFVAMSWELNARVFGFYLSLTSGAFTITNACKRELWGSAHHRNG